MPTLFTADSIDALRRNIVAALPNIAGGISVIVGFWLLAVVTHWMVRRVSIGRRVEPALIRLMTKVAYIGLIITGLIMGLGTMGVNVSALVAGLGLTGFAVGFALKDIISNLLAGVLVILYQTFGEGDRIKVSGFEGKVLRIDLRYTLLDTGSEVVFLPNQLLFNNPVVVVRSEPGGASEAAAAVPNS